MNKFCQRVITIGVVTTATCSVLSYMKIDLMYQNMDKLSETKEVEYITTPSMQNKQLEEILSKVRSIDHYIGSIERYVSNIKSTRDVSNFIEDIYYYTSEIYEIMKNK